MDVKLPRHARTVDDLAPEYADQRPGRSVHVYGHRVPRADAYVVIAAVRPPRARARPRWIAGIKHHAGAFSGPRRFDPASCDRQDVNRKIPCFVTDLQFES